MWASPDPKSVPEEFRWQCHDSRLCQRKITTQWLASFEKEKIIESIAIKVLMSVHWLAQCHTKWPSCWSKMSSLCARPASASWPIGTRWQGPDDSFFDDLEVQVPHLRFPPQLSSLIILSCNFSVGCSNGCLKQNRVKKIFQLQSMPYSIICVNQGFAVKNFCLSCLF